MNLKEEVNSICTISKLLGYRIYAIEDCDVIILKDEISMKIEYQDNLNIVIIDNEYSNWLYKKSSACEDDYEEMLNEVKKYI